MGIGGFGLRVIHLSAPDGPANLIPIRLSTLGRPVRLSLDVAADLVGVWGFEPQTPTVSKISCHRVKDVIVPVAINKTKAAREVTFTLYKLIKRQA